MGQHRIEIQMVGGHGCDRTAKEGEDRTFCRQESCPDCAARALVEKFRSCFVFADSYAKLTHWPGQPSEVVDDLLHGKRLKGKF